MLDHISFAVSNLARAIAFYDAVLQPLGYRRVWTTSSAAGYGNDGADEFFAIREQPGAVPVPADRFHVAFTALTREAVQTFHAAAIGMNGVDEGAPSLNPEYGDSYYAAFVRDPDGYRIEAVLHE